MAWIDPEKQEPPFGLFLACLDNKSIRIIAKGELKMPHGGKCIRYADNCRCIKASSIVAWMPLPKYYERIGEQ